MLEVILAINLKFLKALPLYMLLSSSISNKDVLFIFSTNKVAAEEVPLWVPLEQKIVKDVHRIFKFRDFMNT